MEEILTAEFVLFLLLGLVAKHFVADYMLQTAGMINGKGNLKRGGGYLHAAIHAVGTFVVLTLFSVAAMLTAILCIFEFVVHYAIDYIKANFGEHFSSEDHPWRFWAAHGLDQLAHHLTYIAIVWALVQYGS